MYMNTTASIKKEDLHRAENKIAGKILSTKNIYIYFKPVGIGFILCKIEFNGWSGAEFEVEIFLRLGEVYWKFPVVEFELRI